MTSRALALVLLGLAACATGTTSTSTSTTTTLPTTTSVGTTTMTATTPLPSISQKEVVFAPPSAGLSGDPEASPPSDAELVTVASITDGDTIDVVLSDGTTDTVRLIGINSPESRECFADEAGLVLATLVPVGSQIGMTIDVSDRDQFDRLLRYLWLGGMSVNEEMVRRGAAIARQYPPDTAMASKLDGAQVAAQEQELGLWNPSACGPDAGTEIVVVGVEADAPGDDNDNLNGEYVRIRNGGEVGVDFTGWVLKDESASHRYTLPAGFVLGAGASVTVYSGCGADDQASLYWCGGGAIWNNDGDTAFVLDHNGNIVHSLAYLPPTTTTSSTTTTTVATTQTTSGGNCHPSYPTVCIPPPPPDLDCGDIPYRRFDVVGSDPHRFDGDNDGIGCES